MAAGKIGEQHLQLLRGMNELGRNDPADVAFMHKAAQETGLDTVGKLGDRQAYTALA